MNVWLDFSVEQLFFFLQGNIARQSCLWHLRLSPTPGLRRLLRRFCPSQFCSCFRAQPTGPQLCRAFSSPSRQKQELLYYILIEYLNHISFFYYTHSHFPNPNPRPYPPWSIEIRFISLCNCHKVQYSPTKPVEEAQQICVSDCELQL